VSRLVSIILPVYNAAPFLRAAIASLFDQTYREFEIIAVDDGSTDASRAVLEELAQGDSRIRVFSKENGGCSSALNFAIAKAEGDFIARMDADDLAYRTRLADSVELLSRSDEIALCSTGVDYTFFPGSVFSGARRPRTSAEIRVENIFGTFHIHPTVVFDMRKLDRAAVRYDESYLLAEDFELFSRIDLSHPTAILPEARLLVRRQGHDNVTDRLAARNAGYHFRVAMRQVAAAGIVQADPVALDLLSGEGSIEPDALDIIEAWLGPIGRYEGFGGSLADAYERGLTDFTNNLVAALYGRCGPRQLLGLLRRAGLERHISRLDRLRLLLGATGANRVDHMSNALRRLRRSTKSKPASILAGKLGPEALAGF
jgi:hypothetical protein